MDREMNNCRIIVIALIISLITLGYALSNERIVKKGVWQGQEIEYIDREVIVGLRDNAPRELFEAIKSTYGETELLPLAICGTTWLKISLAQGDVFSVINDLSQNVFVEFAEPNFVGTMHDIYYPNDPFYRDGHQWGLNNTGQVPPGGTPDADIDAEQAWDIEKGDTNTIMAILDTGIPLDGYGNPCHPDLSNPDRIVLGPNFCGIPDNTHGTHVAGIAGAETDNSEGIAGVCGRGRLLILKINYESDGWSVARAIVWTVRYALEHPNKRVVINLSGGWDYPVNLIEYTIWYADQNDVVFVAACDNDLSMGFPAALATSGGLPRLNHPNGYPNVIAVGASDPWDNKAWYSTNWGTVLAPGGFGGGEPGHAPDERDIFSTLPGGYGYFAGCSMAAPHVTGVAGLMLSANPSLSDSLVRHVIAITADDQGDREWDGHSYPPQACGRINAYKSVLASIDFPIFVGFKDYEVDVGDYLEFEVHAYDLNDRETELDYSVVGELPEDAEFSREWPNSYYTFRWPPMQVGLYPIVFRVEDPEENIYEDTINIFINPPDDNGSLGPNIHYSEKIAFPIVDPVDSLKLSWTSYPDIVQVHYPYGQEVVELEWEMPNTSPTTRYLVDIYYTVYFPNGDSIPHLIIDHSYIEPLNTFRGNFLVQLPREPGEMGDYRFILRCFVQAAGSNLGGVIFDPSRILADTAVITVIFSEQDEEYRR